MADFEPPSFSLGLDYNLFDSEPPTSHSSSNQFSVPFSTFEDNDVDFETLLVDDSDPDYPDSHPKLRRRVIFSATSSSTPVRHTDQHLLTQHHVVCTSSNCLEAVTSSCSNTVFPELTASPVRGFCLTPCVTDSYDPVVSRKCNGSGSNLNLNLNNGMHHDLSQHVTRKPSVSNAWEDFPKAYRYFFHDNPRIQELVRSRLRNFFPLGNVLNIDLEQPGTSKIDYMGQFSFSESSKQAARTIKDKKSSTSRKQSRKLKTEDMSQGWVNPKLGIDKVTTKGAVKRKVHTPRQGAGHWLTGSDGKKVYVGKSGQELTGRVAYMQYKKESGLGFRKVKRKSVTKKKK